MRFWKRTPSPELDLTAKLVDALVETNRAILVEMREVSTAIVEASKVRAEPVHFSPIPLAMSEEEEDIEHLRSSGMIDSADYTALMRAAGLTATPIYLDQDDLPEHPEEY